MQLLNDIEHAFSAFLVREFNISRDTALPELLALNADEQKKEFGDLNTTIALSLAKQLKQSPLSLAHTIAQKFSHPAIASMSVAGPGFLNMWLQPSAFEELANRLQQEKEHFFKPSLPHPKTISVEFISANPTGPLHLGHGRGGIIGDVLCNILRFCGNSVTKEFYINDAGAQIVKLGSSLKIRCLQASGVEVTLPEDAYHGDYLVELAQQCLSTYGPEVCNKPESFFATYAKEHMLTNIKNTLQEYGITFDVWFSEKNLHDSGQIQQALDDLQQSGFLYEKDGALWFRSTDFGDDKDRVVKKASGELTYVAADFAYLKNKIMRGHNDLIMILGHDHHSYATRLQGALKALDLAATPLEIILYQLVSIKKGGELIRMSKRTGTMVTLIDIIETVGRDVARFFYLNRKADAHLEFDIALALKKTDENPVFYIQYAYVRTHSILTKAALTTLFANPVFNTQLMDDEERFLLKKIISFKRLLADITHHHQTHLLAYYTLELAQSFNRYYHTHKVLDEQNVDFSRHRLVIIALVNKTLAIAFSLLGISCPERM
jgi:arginyl-tRNA synthetase